jgi:hypothetical protein
MTDSYRFHGSVFNTERFRKFPGDIERHVWITREGPPVSGVVKTLEEFDGAFGPGDGRGIVRDKLHALGPPLKIHTGPSLAPTIPLFVKNLQNRST